jgi:Outer membrane protein beta-barrel domain
MKKKVNIDDLFRKGAQMANEPFDEALWLKAGQMISKTKKPWYATTGFKTITLITAGIVVMLLLWNPFGSGQNNTGQHTLAGANHNETAGNETNSNHAINKNQSIADNKTVQNESIEINHSITTEKDAVNSKASSATINKANNNSAKTNSQNTDPVGKSAANSNPGFSSNTVNNVKTEENTNNKPFMIDNQATGTNDTGQYTNEANPSGNEGTVTGFHGESNLLAGDNKEAFQTPGMNTGSSPGTSNLQSNLELAETEWLTFATKRNLSLNEPVLNADDFKDSRFTGKAREEKQTLFRYYLQGGGMVYSSWQVNNPQILFSPVLGGGVQYGFGRRFSVETGLRYFIRNGVDFSQNTSRVEYSFGVSRRKYEINMDKMHVLQMPVLLKYDFGLRHGLHIGAGFAYVLNTSGQYTEKQRDDTGWIVIDSSRQSGYLTGIGRFNMNIDFGYYYKINAMMELNAGFQYGLTDVILQKVQGLDRNEKFTHFQIQFRYYLK